MTDARAALEPPTLAEIRHALEIGEGNHQFDSDHCTTANCSIANVLARLLADAAPVDAERLAEAMYDDGCIQPPQTDHVAHVLAALASAPSEPEEDWDPHAVDDQHPCFICGRVTSHDHSTAEWNAALALLPSEDRS